ncbi:type II/IV secretion system ATPase subunit [Candidatus Micrarchaeota archaeon]|nr:type II/IV secretion system ATPase subunit [Candidatus Micrarchaeota archaeon]
MAGEAVVKIEGETRRLVINTKGLPFGSDLALYPEMMKLVVEKLKESEADEIVLSEYYERIYSKEQTVWLKGIADLITRLESDAIWSPSHLGTDAKGTNLAPRHEAILKIMNALYADPLKAYLTLISELKTWTAKAAGLTGADADDVNTYLGTLNFIRQLMEKTDLIRKMKEYISQLGSLPADRGIYHSLFEVAIKPSFIGSRIFFTGVENLELVDQYDVIGTKIYIYKHPEKVEFLYFINPPEYTLAPDKYFLLEKTKEVVSGHRPGEISFMGMSQARQYFHKIYIATISDLARQYNIKLTIEEKEDLATIVSRYTIGYGIMEILLSDRQLTDVYIDAPLGIKPVYLVHSKYGQCQTNIIFSSEEAQAITSRFRALSGRPFDEAHPILDFDLEELQTRIAVIGKPLSLDGIAFAYRLHKDTPWTLSQFLDNKMFNKRAAGMFSFFVDAQASMLIVGSRGSGKTSFLQAMMQEIPQNLRILVQEDTAELPIPSLKRLGFNIQRMKTRPPLGKQSESEVSAEDALRTALRLGDSVLIVGEVRSGEAKALYEAMRVGAVGNVVMGTIHGESAYSIWDRVVNDLGVPTTSFKATDMCIVSAPIRFGGSIKRERRVIEVTEVLKHWNVDPGAEKGFLNWLQFDANSDSLEFFEDQLNKSEWIEKIKRTRGMTYEDIFNEINARGETKQYLVDVKNKLGVPKLLEAENTIRAHTRYLIEAEKQREENGAVMHEELLQNWRDWVDSTLVKEVLAQKRALNQ